jgi:murein DD-endopeptidase MepM/ murein hydrolase activator NlpD
LIIGSVGLLLMVIGILLLYGLFQDNHSGAEMITATPPDPTQSAPTPDPDALGLGLVLYDYTGQYAFLIAADPHLFTWTHYHWDGTNAADLEVRFGVSYPDFARLTNAPLVAVTSGIALNYSGSVGGQGYMLQGDDGVDYYYAHLSQQWVADGARVTAGQPLGVIGSTGGSAQFIEPHLHIAIGPRDSLWESQPGINAAEWLYERFNLGWQDRPAVSVTFDQPQGWPVTHSALAVLTTFDQALAQGLPQPALELGFTQTPPDASLDIIATLDGEVNVIRWTAQYGTRIQIDNEPAQSTVVISGVDEWLVQDGDKVSRGQIIGRWNPVNRPKLHYMIYQDGVMIDPAPTLGGVEQIGG